MERIVSTLYRVMVHDHHVYAFLIVYASLWAGSLTSRTVFTGQSADDLSPQLRGLWFICLGANPEMAIHSQLRRL